MSAVSNKNKVTSLAKDFGMKSRDLLAVIPGLADIKPAPSTLTDDEKDYAITVLSGKCIVENIDDYINGKLPLAPYSAEEEKKPESKPEEAKSEPKAEEKKNQPAQKQGG
ncbi:MAG: hypothetical protein IKM49_01675, partial [Ruminococcus sp.]|nr:hypothetical protein [Ruminococcus sp.]